jgi:hypothetical protein
MVQDNLEVNTWCGLTKDRITGPFLYAETAITCQMYLDIRKQFTYPKKQICS